ncbi:MAG: 2-phospho-L-lactate transferase [Promethearchaeota archaeon]|nr:MAG: 2-phospho-L-lactate transferase [Candidatus Lokiarchaeota archaeon]
MPNDFYVLLAGGVGAAKFIEGLANVVNPELLKIIVNTGDDIDLFGLNICPDLDIITYTLANVIDKEKGWGFVNESFNCLSILKKFYNSGWFNLGDKDLAIHIYRTDLLKQGFTKAEVTKTICEKLGVKAEIIPMCNEKVETYIKTPLKTMHFEEYYIKYQSQPEILGVEFKGIENAKPNGKIFEYLKRAKKIIICPSNPIVSIGTILQLGFIREALKKEKNKIYAISPIIQGETVKGPADKLLRISGFNVSCVGVANFYQEIVGHFIIDNKDCNLKAQIDKLKIKPYCFDTLMINFQKKKELAQFIIGLN